MKCEKILTHKYKKQIDKMCFSDDAATKISNWVNNTVDADAEIPADEKLDYYIKETDIREYKKILTEKAADMALRIKSTNPEVTSSVDPIGPIQAEDGSISTAVVSLSEDRIVTSLIEKDIGNNLLDVNATLQNLLQEAQSQMVAIQQSGNTDISTQRVVLGYMTEIRNSIKDYSKILGVEEYLREKAKQSVHGNTNSLTIEKREALRDLIVEVLKVADLTAIPTILHKLDKIIGDVNA